MPWGIAVTEPEREHWSVEQVDSAKTGLPSFLERLEIDGVRRARTDIAPEPQWSPSFDTRAALVTINGHAESDGVWFTLSVLPRPGAPVPTPAKRDGDPFVPDWSALSEACDGWEYKMPAEGRHTAPDARPCAGSGRRANHAPTEHLGRSKTLITARGVLPGPH